MENVQDIVFNDKISPLMRKKVWQKQEVTLPNN